MRTLMFKITNGLAPKYLCDSFQYVSDIHSRNTRSSCNNKLYIPKPTLHLSKTTETQWRHLVMLFV